MLVLLMLVGCLSVQAEDGYSRYPLGRGIYVPDFDIMGVLEETQTQVLKESKLDSCLFTENTPASTQSFNFYRDTKTFYSSTTNTFGLGTSLQTDFSLGFTLDSVTTSISGSKRTVTGNSLLITAATSQAHISSECLYLRDNFDETFISDLEKLPLTIDSPWLLNSWKPYEVFVKKHGSHMITSMTFGSSINQMAFAETSESYSERDFQIKSCISLAGPADLGASGSMCSGVEQSDIERVNSMSMSSKLVVMGGEPETRNEILQHRSDALIEQFMNEAQTTKAPITYTFTSFWEILQGTFAGNYQDNFIRSMNLEYYYLGYLNYGCGYQSSDGGQILQKFQLSAAATPSIPQYECTLAASGCHSNGDCHYKPIWCSCRGPSCIQYKEQTLSTGNIKTTAIVNDNSDWGWNGCDWKPGLAGSKCICRWPSSTRKIVWGEDSKSAAFLAVHNRHLSRIAKGTEKQEL